MIHSENEGEKRIIMRKITLCLIVFLLIIICFVSPTYVFDGNDYDSGDFGGGWSSDFDSGGGWSSDFGGGGWSSDFGSSWNRDYNNGTTWKRDNNSSSVRSSDYNSDGGGSSSEAVFIYLLIALFGGSVIFVFSSTSTKSKKSSPREGQNIWLPNRTEEIERIINEHDPNFSARDFIAFVEKVYIDIQTAWCERDLESVRIYLHDNLYDATIKQIQAKIEQDVAYHYENMVVNNAYPTSYTKDKQFEYLTVYLNASMIDWQEDEKTGTILRGDKTTRWDLRYKMKFMRSTGNQTNEETSKLVEPNCPNCAAPLEMTSSAKCKFCGAIITTGKYKWVLSDFGTIRNDTIDEGINTEME